MDPVEQGSSNSNTTAMQRQLPTALQLHVLSFVSHNERVLSGRLASKDVCDALREPHHRTASLSQPLPPHAVPWAMEAGQQHVRQVPFRHKLQLLCTAAASGSEVNLEVALALLQPIIFPELLHRWAPYDGPDPGVAEVEAGHPQLLGWLLHRCPGLVHSSKALAAAAWHCDLAGLQATWEVLSISCNTAARPTVDQGVLDTAARSPCPGAVAKMEWVLTTAGEDSSCSLQGSTAAAAARSGDLDRLRWLHDRGCPVGGLDVLASALQHADLAVAQWLVDEAGCELPEPGSAYGDEWKDLFTAAVKSCDGVAKLQWLLESGAPTLGSIGAPLRELAVAAVRSGQMGVLQHLQAQAALLLDVQDEVAPPWYPWKLKEGAVASGSVAMAEHLTQHGLVFSVRAFEQAARAGDAAMVRWLALEAGVATAGLDLAEVVHAWPRKTPAHSRGLLAVVQLLVEEAGCSGWDAEAAVRAAAARGDLALVQYLHGNWQPGPGQQLGWGRAVCAAAEGGCEAVLEWVVQQPGCQLVPGDAYTYVVADKNGDVGTLVALRRLGVPWGGQAVVRRALLFGCQEPGLRWLVEQGAPVGSVEGMEEAVACVVGRAQWTAEGAEWLRGVVEAAAGGP